MQFNNPASTKNENENMTTLHLRKSIGRSPSRLGSPSVQPIWIIRGFLLIPLALACFALSPTARAVSPAPDGGYPNGNTAEGTHALFSLTTGDDNTANGSGALYHNTTGFSNTANGFEALYYNTRGYRNTANGGSALYRNTTGTDNTANGDGALSSNTTGFSNTANGSDALSSNTTGKHNTANGDSALLNNTTGTDNTANGDGALAYNTTGNDNTATGVDALQNNTTLNGVSGHDNTATGFQALYSNTTGIDNTAEGFQALLNNTGSNNIGLGSNAGSSLTTGSNNIDIGNVGVAAESNKIRIGKLGTQTATFVAGIYNVNEGGTIKAVYINSNGQLGTQAPASSRRFKKEIKPMDQTSEAVLALKPVTFQYKSDSSGTPQFGLIAEEVANVSPDLIVRDEKGEIYTVRYEAVNAMLLNEFLKEHRKVEQLKKDFEFKLAEQQKQMKALTSALEKVSAQLEASKPAPQMVGDNQ